MPTFMPTDEPVPELTTCTPDKLHKHTIHGWRLVEVLSERYVREALDQVPNPALAADQYVNERTVDCLRAHVEERPMFLMARVNPENNVAAQLRKANRRIKALEDEVAKVTEANAELIDQRDAANRGEAAADRAADRLCKDKDQLREQVRRFEIDIGKIREAIGTRELGKILRH